MADLPESPGSHTASPSTSNGPPDGPEPQAAGAALARPVPALGPDMEPGPASAPAATGAAAAAPGPDPDTDRNPAARAALTGEPGTLPPTWCKKCQATVDPVDKGKCPRCGAFLRLNFVSRRHAINKLRRQQILDQLVADYRPTTTLGHSSCDMLAGILEQLEVLKPGSPDHQRLVQLSQQLGASLEESRAPRAADDDTADLNIDALVEQSAEILRQALALQRAAQAPPSTDTTPFDTTPIVSSAEAPVADQLVKAEPTATSAPEPRCEYCHQTLTRCAEIKATQLDSWEVLHYNDPQMIEQRAKLLTQEMYESLRRQRYGDPNVR